MKNIFFFILLIINILSCKKENIKLAEPVVKFGNMLLKFDNITIQATPTLSQQEALIENLFAVNHVENLF
ncbi:MAG: hypothetical protein RLZZ292_366 [Bacteroidota bacterium]